MQTDLDFSNFIEIRDISMKAYSYKQIVPANIDQLKKYVIDDPRAVGFTDDGMIKFYNNENKHKPGNDTLYLYKPRLNRNTPPSPSPSPSPSPIQIPMIPKKIHFIWFSGGRKFNLVNYLAIKAAIHHHPNFTIYLHCDATPESDNIYFKDLKEKLSIQYFKDPTYINGNYVQYYQNRADYVRLNILKKMGGIYLDTDIILLRKLDCFLNNMLVIGYERPDSKEYVCNAVIMSIADHPLINEWLSMYEESWGEKFIGWYIGHSLIMGSELCEKHRHLINIVPNDTFYPFTWTDHSIIEKMDNGKTYSDSFSVHLWDTEFQKTSLLPEGLEYFETNSNALTRLFGHYVSNLLSNKKDGEEEEWMVLENMDMIGNDLEFKGGKTVDELKVLCKKNSKCVAFNTIGFMKDKIEMDKLCYLSERGFNNCKSSDALYIYKPRFVA